jgi:CII-binding regulator of phage lambda lysogenization HflD
MIMADLRITTAAVTPGTGGLSQTAKVGPSKFDVIRSQITEKVAADVKLPAVAPPSSQQISSIQKELAQKLEQTNARSATEFFQGSMKNTRSGMDTLANAIGKLPPQSQFAPLRDRLNELEKQFQKSGNLIEGINDMNPKSLLNVQMQLYQLSGNIELMSKVVDQVSSGVKTMLQTQV